MCLFGIVSIRETELRETLGKMKLGMKLELKLEMKLDMKLEMSMIRMGIDTS